MCPSSANWSPEFCNDTAHSHFPCKKSPFYQQLKSVTTNENVSQHVKSFAETQFYMNPCYKNIYVSKHKPSLCSKSSIMFPPPQKTKNTPYFQYPVHLCIRMHTNRCHVMVTTQPYPRPCVIFHTMLASKTELLYSCQHYVGEPPHVSHLQMAIKYIHSYIMLENHPLSAICIWLLNIITATKAGEPPLVSQLHMAIYSQLH